MHKRAILRWLKNTDPAGLRYLYGAADLVRKKNVGEAIHLRGLIEISNHCRRSCAYCGLSACRRGLRRYRMSRHEILKSARLAERLGYGTVVLQAGEDPGLGKKWVADLVRDIKSKTRLAVTLSLGERTINELKAWKMAGADRYLLRFETSDTALFQKIHPPARGMKFSGRIPLLRKIRAMGYETGSGIMVGIPGQNYDSLAEDLLYFQKLDLEMIGLGPWLPHPETPLGRMKEPFGSNQVPHTEEMTLKALAIARLLRPDANIPSTTALATLNRKSGREHGLCCGGNVVMPNLTPLRYRKLYEIYPSKVCIFESPAKTAADLDRSIKRLRRSRGRGPGGRGPSLKKEFLWPTRLKKEAKRLTSPS